MSFCLIARSPFQIATVFVFDSLRIIFVKSRTPLIMYGNFHKSRPTGIRPAFGKFSRTFFVEYSRLYKNNTETALDKYGQFVHGSNHIAIKQKDITTVFSID